MSPRSGIKNLFFTGQDIFAHGLTPLNGVITASEIEKKNLINKFNKGLREKNSIKGDITTEVKFLEYETWCLVWFNHYTYNESYSDKEILISFEEFVRRKMPLQQALSRSFKDNNKESHYCLMGAEDRWRWNICRCEKCQERNVVTIDH